MFMGKSIVILSKSKTTTSSTIKTDKQKSHYIELLDTRGVTLVSDRTKYFTRY